MNTLTKVVAGAVTAATLTVSLATPAAAQRYRDYYDDRYYGRDRGIDTGDILTGVAVLGGIERCDFAIHASLAHATGDELGHLRPEIDDQDGVGRLDGHESP